MKPCQLPAPLSETTLVIWRYEWPYATLQSDLARDLEPDQSEEAWRRGLSLDIKESAAQLLEELTG